MNINTFKQILLSKQQIYIYIDLLKVKWQIK